MKKTASKSKNNQTVKMIEKALHTGGYLIPQTVDEVKEFERLYGTTEVILPSELQESIYENRESKGVNNVKIAKLPSENFAMAAREGKKELPKEIQQKIIRDIKDSELKGKKKKK